MTINLAVVYLFSAEYDSSIAEYNKGIELGMGLPQYYNGRGMAKYNLKDYSGAIADLTIVINNNPDNGMTWYYRGLAFSKLNKQAEASADWAQARKLGFKEPVTESATITQ